MVSSPLSRPLRNAMPFVVLATELGSELVRTLPLKMAASTVLEIELSFKRVRS